MEASNSAAVVFDNVGELTQGNGKNGAFCRVQLKIQNTIMTHVQMVEHGAKPIGLIVQVLLFPPSKEEKDSFRSGPHGFGLHSCQSFFEALENKPEHSARTDFVSDPRHGYPAGTNRWISLAAPPQRAPALVCGCFDCFSSFFCGLSKEGRSIFHCFGSTRFDR